MFVFVTMKKRWLFRDLCLLISITLKRIKKPLQNVYTHIEEIFILEDCCCGLSKNFTFVFHLTGFTLPTALLMNSENLVSVSFSLGLFLLKLIPSRLSWPAGFYVLSIS